MALRPSIHEHEYKNKQGTLVWGILFSGFRTSFKFLGNVFDHLLDLDFLQVLKLLVICFKIDKCSNLYWLDISIRGSIPIILTYLGFVYSLLCTVNLCPLLSHLLKFMGIYGCGVLKPSPTFQKLVVYV